MIHAYAKTSHATTPNRSETGIFSARYAYLATWDLVPLLRELAGHEIDISSAREEFRSFLLSAGR